ncbi:MAG: hypothetical protein WBA67_17175 [Jannaschia sp.]
MTYIVRSALLVAALSVSTGAGFVSAASATESATNEAPQTLITVKGDRGSHSPTAQMILASIAAEGN